MIKPVLLITRPRPDAERFLAALGGVGAEVVISSVTRIVPLPGELPEGTRGVILTSANAVGPVPVPPGMTAWCVGDRTAEAARAAGLDARSAGGDAGDLIAMILGAAPGGPLVHLRGEHVAADVVGALTEASIPATDLIVYRQDAVPLSEQALAALDGAAPVILPVFSPRSAEALGDLTGHAAPRHVVAISEAAARAARSLAPASLTVAETPDLPAMVAATRCIAASL